MEKEQIILAAGCFWGVEHLLKQLEGVLRTEVGYTGGTTENPTYKEVCTGKTNHAESVRVTFNPEIISLEKIISAFWRLHDPTQVNRQHNDIGTQYRSAIFYFNDQQKKVAEKSKTELQQSGQFEKNIATQILKAQKFYSAESEHQNYLDKNPDGYMCHFWRE